MTPANAYARNAKAGMSTRELEASALIRAAARLTGALESGDASAISDAVTHNHRLWAYFAAAAADAASPLPKEMRGNILTLAAFVFNQSLTCTSRREGEVVPRLIAINRDVAAGLRRE